MVWLGANPTTAAAPAATPSSSVYHLGPVTSLTYIIGSCRVQSWHLLPRPWRHQPTYATYRPRGLMINKKKPLHQQVWFLCACRLLPSLQDKYWQSRSSCKVFFFVFFFFFFSFLNHLSRTIDLSYLSQHIYPSIFSLETESTSRKNNNTTTNLKIS